MIKYTLIGHLFDSLEGSNYNCSAGPLKNDQAYALIKQLFYDKLAEPIPKYLIDKYGLNSHLDDKQDFEGFDGEDED